MMTSSNMKYTILSILFAFAALTSCIDDDIICVENTEIPEDITNGYSLNFTVTLDKMGGTRSIEGLGNPMEAMEDYVDLEKFRILFFNKDDKFLFESKSRWVKRLTPTTDDHTRWLVSVPVFPYGNDAEENWEWERIRKTLRNEGFKIAILANRPEMDMAVEFDDIEQREEWFDNTGPHWGVNDAVGGTEVKDIFDLHHSQYDPIYTYKSYSDAKSYPNNPYYEFITGKGTHKGYKGDAPSTYDVRTMSSTSSWVTWDKAITTWGTKKDDNGNLVPGTVRYFRLPDESYPIPMYGIQQFEPLTDWKEGTTYNLTRKGDVTDKPISLLRSVVKVELIIPKTTYKEMEYVYVIYPNIYARCEPMNVWKPTDELWGESHTNGTCSDWDHIAAYGPISRSTDAASTGVKEYQNRMLWFYGAWRNKWPFEAGNGFDSESRFDELAAEGFGEDTYPQIYNSCIQRNTAVAYDIEKNNFDTNEYFRYIVYLGERDINDPSKLNELGKVGSGSATISYWRFKFKNGKAYNIPFTDLRNVSNLDDIIDDMESIDSQGRPTTGSGDGMDEYEKEVHNMNSTWPKPWPLIRNHVYRITVTTKDEMSYYWNFGEISFGTENDMTNAANWSNPGGVETKKLYHNILSNSVVSNGKVSATIDWGWGDNNPKLTRNSDNQFNSDSQINGYTSIKTGKGENSNKANPDDRTTVLTLPTSKVIKKLTLYSFVKDFNQNNKVTYAIKSSENHAAGETVNVNNGTETVATLTFGFAGEAKFQGIKDSKITDDMRYYIEGNGVNGTGTSGTVYIIKPKYSGSIEVGVVLNADKGFYVLEDDIALDNYNGIKVTAKYQGLYSFSVKRGSTYKIFCTGSKLGFYGFNYTYSTDDTPYYWSNVAGIDTSKESGMYASDASNPDKFVFGDEMYEEYTPTNEISFTSSNSGKQICYIAEIKVENRDNSMTDYWELLNSPNNAELKADNKVINEFRGLKFTGGTIRVYDRKDDEDKDKFCLIGNTKIIFPSLSKAYTITIKGRTAVSGTTPSIQPVGTSATSGQHTFNDDESTFTWEVAANSAVQLQLANNGGGVYLYEASVEPQSGNSAQATRAADGGLNFKIKSEDLHSESIRFD